MSTHFLKMAKMFYEVGVEGMRSSTNGGAVHWPPDANDFDIEGVDGVVTVARVVSVNAAAVT